MTNNFSVVDIGKLSKPATTLIEKVSEAVGGIAKPWQIERVAKAEAKAELIRAQARIEISELQERALRRMVEEEGKKQENIESITAKAVPLLGQEAKPEDIENDWLTHFFDRSRLVSDDQMQTLWARVLAGQANSPNSFRKRTVDLVATLEKSDAELFTKLCTFGWMLGTISILVFDHQNAIYNKHGINFSSLNHLANLGLITFSSISTYEKRNFGKYAIAFYYGKPVMIEFPENEHNKLSTGQVLLTQAGQELASICGSAPAREYFDAILQQWYEKGYVLSAPIDGRDAWKAF